MDSYSRISTPKEARTLAEDEKWLIFESSTTRAKVYEDILSKKKCVFKILSDCDKTIKEIRREAFHYIILNIRITTPSARVDLSYVQDILTEILRTNPNATVLLFTIIMRDPGIKIPVDDIPENIERVIKNKVEAVIDLLLTSQEMGDDAIKKLIDSIDPFDIPEKFITSLSPKIWSLLYDALENKYGEWIMEKFRETCSRNLVFCDHEVVKELPDLDGPSDDDLMRIAKEKGKIPFNIKIYGSF